jgi:hypothetical protein
MELKLEKKMLEKNMEATISKMNRLGNVLKKKALRDQSSKVPVESTIRTKTGLPLSEFTLKKNKIRVPVEELRNKVTRTHEDIDPEVVKPGSNLERIRFLHTARTTGKNLVKEGQRRAEEKKMALEKKKARGKRSSFPKITVPPSMFPNRYIRAELPCTIEHGMKGWYLSWVCPLEKLDYEYYLPIFFDGLQCAEQPSNFIAAQGIEDLLYAAKGDTDKIAPCVYNCIRPLRNALSKFDTTILLKTLKAIQQLIASAPGIGEVLLPYSKQFLAPMAAFLDMNKNLGDGIDYAQRKNNDVGEEVRKTLELLEETGGEGSLKAIKFSIPLYESCLKGNKK